ncbi:MAG: hypothetical protein J6G98_00175 [Bacilli bacterium]|nr:hypothetical protein [Bacilli bacterium]
MNNDDNIIVSLPEHYTQMGYDDAIKGEEKKNNLDGMSEYFYDTGYYLGMNDKTLHSNTSSEQTFGPVDESKDKYNNEDKQTSNAQINNDNFGTKLYEEGKKAAIEGYDINDFIKGFEEGTRMRESLYQVESYKEPNKPNNYSGVSDGEGGIISLEQFEEYGIDPNSPNAREQLETAVQNKYKSR